MTPQVLLYLYLRERLPDPRRPRQARVVRWSLTAVFSVMNLPWVLIARRVLFGSVWGVGRVPYTAPWIAWQILGWVFCGLVTVYLLGKGVWWLAGRALGRSGGQPRAGASDRLTARPPERLLSRRQFLARATYTYAAAGAALSAYGIWNAYRLPLITRRTLTFTAAATLSSFTRIVPAVACANSVPCKVKVRSRSNIKYAKVASHSRN